MSVFHLQRKSTSNVLPGTFSDLAAIPGPAGQIITAARAPNLKLITWRATASGSITKLADSGTQAGATSGHIDMVRGRKVITAARTADGDLRLISWDVDPDTGAITRAGDSGEQGGQATQIRIALLLDTRFVTASRSSSGRVTLISWGLNADGSLRRLGDSGNAGDPAAEVELLRLSTTGGDLTTLVTPIIDAAGNLKIIRWTVTNQGDFTRVGESGILATGTQSLRAATASLNRPVVAYRDRLGLARLLVCSLTADGRVQRLAESGPSPATIDGLAGTHDGVVSAARMREGEIHLIGWKIAPDGTVAQGVSTPGDMPLASQVTLVSPTGVRGLSLVSAFTTPEGRLQLEGWGQPVVRLHFKLVAQPDLGVDALVASTAQVFAQVGIKVEHASTETLDLGEEFEVVEVGSCIEPTDEQRALFQHRKNVGPRDVVVYVVESLDPILLGCASHPPDRPGVIVAQFADEWTVAHEVGHVLGLNHVSDSNRLMTDNGTIRITNPPPDLVALEASAMLESPYTF